MKTHYTSEERYRVEEGLVNQWIRVMGNCGKLLIVGVEWIWVYGREFTHKLPRDLLPNLRVYKNERIREEAIKVYEDGVTNSYIDYDSNYITVENQLTVDYNSPKLGSDTYVFLAHQKERSALVERKIEKRIQAIKEPNRTKVT